MLIVSLDVCPVLSLLKELVVLIVTADLIPVCLKLDSTHYVHPSLFSHGIYRSQFPMDSSLLLNAEAIEVFGVDLHRAVGFGLINVAVPSALLVLQHLSHYHLDRLLCRYYLSAGCVQYLFASLAVRLLKNVIHGIKYLLLRWGQF